MQWAGSGLRDQVLMQRRIFAFSIQLPSWISSTKIEITLTVGLLKDVVRHILTLRRFYAAVPKSWNLNADTPYPQPIVTPEQGRKRALSAYETRGF